MLSVRLPKDLEYDLEAYSTKQHISKSDIVKEAITKYLSEAESLQTSFDLGKDLFGKYSSEETDLSRTYKKRVKEKLGEKFNR